MPINLKTLTDEEFIAPGRSGCPGCASMVVARLALKTLGENTILVSATGCLISNITHAGAPLVPFMHSLLPGAGSLIAGIDAGLNALEKRKDINLVAIGGDGGTADIGLQALSGAAERGHKFIYICYDNEGYMNTGGQRSGTTSFGASTATTPVKSVKKGETRAPQRKKDMLLIMAAHGIPYCASASIGFPQDLIRKIEKAQHVEGPSYLHVLTPCNYRWGFDEDQSIRVAKAAVETRVAPLVEIEGGRHFTLGRRSRPRKSVEVYLEMQRRFRHLSVEAIAQIQTEVDERWEYLERLSSIE
jgi:pyruvate ferredoxin oxidoreductase beta subunit